MAEWEWSALSENRAVCKVNPVPGETRLSPLGFYISACWLRFRASESYTNAAVHGEWSLYRPNVLYVWRKGFGSQ